jgi:hypothetical protein
MKESPFKFFNEEKSEDSPLNIEEMHNVLKDLENNESSYQKKNNEKPNISGIGESFIDFKIKSSDSIENINEKNNFNESLYEINKKQNISDFKIKRSDTFKNNNEKHNGIENDDIDEKNNNFNESLYEINKKQNNLDYDTFENTEHTNNFEKNNEIFKRNENFFEIKIPIDEEAAEILEIEKKKKEEEFEKKRIEEEEIKKKKIEEEKIKEKKKLEEEKIKKKFIEKKITKIDEKDSFFITKINYEGF